MRRHSLPLFLALLLAPAGVSAAGDADAGRRIFLFPIPQAPPATQPLFLIAQAPPATQSPFLIAQAPPATQQELVAGLPGQAQAPDAPMMESDEDARARTEASAGAAESVTNKGWFWGSLAGVVLTAVAIIVLTNQPSEAPETSLGNMEAFRSR